VHQFYAPAESALLARVVPAPRFGSASSLSSLALSLAQLLGMVMLAPLLLKLERPLVLFAVCSLLFIAAAVVLMRMDQIKPSPTNAELSSRGPRAADVSLRAGWRAALRDPVAFAALLDWVLIGVGLSTLVVIVPQYLERVLDTSSENTVYVFAPAAIGLVAGLQVAPFLGRIAGFGRLAATGLLVFAVAVALMGFVEHVVELLGAERFPLATFDSLGIEPNVGATMLISVPAGFAISLVTVSARTELMLRMPEEVHARVFATQMTLGNLAALVPALMAGVLIDIIGVAPVAVVVALTLVAGAVYGRRLGGRLRTASGLSPLPVSD
jgi:MFS family permease